MFQIVLLLRIIQHLALVKQALYLNFFFHFSPFLLLLLLLFALLLSHLPFLPSIIFTKLCNHFFGLFVVVIVTTVFGLMAFICSLFLLFIWLNIILSLAVLGLYLIAALALRATFIII